jgi:hypothetical protein
MTAKICTKCKSSKEITEFSPKGNGKFASRCKSCIAEIRRNNYVSIKQESKEVALLTSSKKECSSCHVFKDICEFYKNYNCSTHRNECKECNRIRAAAGRASLKEFLIELKSKPCTDCGREYPYYVMDFDHLDGYVKNYNISELRFVSKNLLLEEIAKCDLVCSNCHRIRTHNRLKK